MAKISIFAEHESLLPRAEKLAKKLNLPIISGAAISNADQTENYILLVSEKYLALWQPNIRSKPFYIDFSSKRLTYRRQHASVRRETLARALGLKSNSQTTIVDATAGLARDSFILASLGFEITLLERSPLIAELLNDGIQRANLDVAISPIIKRMRVIQTEAVTWMQQQTLNDRPEIIYLDPMYAERNHTALAKKEMRIFQDIIGADSDAALLLPAALACATKRVVVKRPRLAENLADIPPSFSQEGSSSRFDIYLL
jgi:16S rRNA (guanine1516-N2)-methyltransferase